MASLPQTLVDIFKDIGIRVDQATWDCHGTPVALHKALEQVAAHKKITFDPPTMIESDAEKKKVVMLVTGRLGNLSEWSIGEATVYNNKNTYPYAMAEKRAKDRVILKLICVAGYVYSESEADSMRDAKPDNMVDTINEKIAASIDDAEQAGKEAYGNVKMESTPAQPPPANADVSTPEGSWAAWVENQKKIIDSHNSLGALNAWANQTAKPRADLESNFPEIYDPLRNYFNAKYDKLNEELGNG